MSRASRPPELTTTSYAILGLLAIKPWTTYELAQQMERTLNRVWPRARSKLYEEPKKLVAHGLASAKGEAVGRRPRTVYRITAKGRRALAAWLATPSEPPAIESEPHVKLFFSGQGTTADARATIDAVEAWAEAQLAAFAEVAATYVEGTGPFPERMATNALGARFLVDVYNATKDWARWAREVVERWPDSPADAVPDVAVYEDLVRRATGGRR